MIRCPPPPPSPPPGVLQACAAALRLDASHALAGGPSALPLAAVAPPALGELGAAAWATLARGAELLVPFPEGLELAERLFRTCFARHPDAGACARGSKRCGGGGAAEGSVESALNRISTLRAHAS